MFKKFNLGDYRWISYEDLDSTADYFGRGLRSLGLNPREKLCVYADTRAEWMIAAQGAFKQAFPVATLYTNLGNFCLNFGADFFILSLTIFKSNYFEPILTRNLF